MKEKVEQLALHFDQLIALRPAAFLNHSEASKNQIYRKSIERHKWKHLLLHNIYFYKWVSSLGNSVTNRWKVLEIVSLGIT